MRVMLSAAILLAASSAAAANAETAVRFVDRAECLTHTVQHPDGSSDSEQKCHTSSDGTR